MPALHVTATTVLVLIGLMAGQALTAVVLLRLVAGGRVVRVDPHQRCPR